MAQMTVQIVTPDGLVFDHHATFVSVEVKVKRIDEEDHVNWIAVNGGIVEVADNLITIIADSAERARDIDISRAERAKLRAERAIEEAQEKHLIDQERRARIALQRAINRINVGTRL